MKTEITMLRKKVPGAAILTSCEVKEGILIFQVVIKSGEEILSQATRVYPVSALPVDANETLMDALSYMGTVGTEESPAVSQATEETPAAKEETVSMSKLDIEKKEAPSEPTPATEDGTGNEQPPLDSDESTKRSRSVSVKSSGKGKKGMAVEAAEEVVFVPTDSAPAMAQKLAGRKMGEIAAENISVVNFLVQTAKKGNTYCSEACLEAAKILKMQAEKRKGA